MSRNVYVSNTTHTMQPNVRNTRRALHQVFEMNVRLRRRVICRRSFNGVGARDDEHESESDEHMSLRFRLTPTTVPVNASSSFRFRIFLPPPPPPPLPLTPPTTTADDLLLTSLLIGSTSIRPHDRVPGSAYLQDVNSYPPTLSLSQRRRRSRCAEYLLYFLTRINAVRQSNSKSRRFYTRPSLPTLTLLSLPPRCP